ncbi:ATP-binding protein [Fulvimarina sp. MAC8]|uniref:sensor histidine kinase n=1 Tax=Fulvimarina sp. MAC8 TaxID=3162874 RepID=UPI0032EEFFA8
MGWEATSAPAQSGRPAIRRRFWLLRGFAAVSIVAIAILAIVLAGRFAADRERERIVRDAVETLNVQTAVLEGILDKYRLLTPLVAQAREIRSILSPPGAPLIEIDRNEALLEVGRITAMSGALDVALLSADREIIASSRNRLSLEDDEVQSALDVASEGRLGRQSLILPDGERAYLFTWMVRRERNILGYVTVLVGFESVESTWALSKNPILVTDKFDRIFLTNRPEWGIETLPAIDSAAWFARIGDLDVPYLERTRYMPLLEWQVHVLASTSAITQAALYSQALAALLVVLFASTIGVLIRRREQAILRERRDRSVALKLERKVRDRTRALSRANQTLTGEVEERRQTEEKLRKTQNELVQTAKLAGLGQMAATLGHEFNQPIAAIRTYADNAERLIASDRTEMAAQNLKRITAMTERMAEMSKTLLAFARKPGTTSSPIALGAVLDEAMILVRPRLKKTGIKLTIAPELRDVEVIGGKIRLSQVFVNLINNAADAIGETSGSRIEVTLSRSSVDGIAEIEIRDDGPGIPTEMQSEIFEPFFTTKSSGEGIGIGLSIVSNILADFGGTIRLLKSGPEGTVFAIRLRNADSAAIAAE